MNEQEVLDADNLCLTLYAKDNSEDSHDTPIRTTPADVLPTTETSPSPADRNRALRGGKFRRNVGRVRRFVCATDPQTRQSHDVHNLHQFGDVEEAQTVVVLDVDHCSWCGFRDHNRKTRKACPQPAP